MFKRLNDNEGQGFGVQYALLFFVVVAAITGMSIYMRRVIQGRTLDAVRYMSDNVVNGIRVYPNLVLQGNFTDQYEPYYTQSELDRRIDQSTIRTISNFSRIDYDFKTFSNSEAEQLPAKDAR